MTTGTSIDNAAPAQLDARSHRRDGRPERLLAWVLYGFPLWWVLGLSHFIFIIMAAPMMWTLLRRRPVLAFSGFGWWLLFMAWVAASASMIYLQAPGTRRQSGLNPLVAYGYDAGWYLAITVVALYVLNSTERELPRLRVIRMLGFMFCVTVAGGIAGLLLPGVEFPSALEYVLPESFTSNGFVYNLVHLRLSLSTSFLGYEQARITAPFAYPNAWGNNFGLYLPFFIVAWMGKDAGWRRAIAPFILLAAVAPVVLALNRGLWLGLLLVGAYWLIRLLLQRNVRAIAVSSTIAVFGVMILVLSPLGQTVALRLNTPHSDDRRESTATEVISATAQASPLLGFGTTRQKLGNYGSIAGAETPDCRQCAAPPLGTQGYWWGVIFANGFVGAALLLIFLLRSFLTHARSRDVVSVLLCISVLQSLFYFFFYDSLEAPMYTLLIIIGLAFRPRTGLGSDPADQLDAGNRRLVHPRNTVGTSR